MSLSLKALPKESSAELVAISLRQAILDGKLLPGGRLKEQELAAQFEISRGPIREAIRILSSENLVEHHKNCGAVVSMPTVDDVLEVYAIRMSLGAIAGDHLARKRQAGEVNMSSLEALLKSMSIESIKMNNAKMIQADLEFQNQLMALSGLPRISEAMEKSAVDIRFFVRALKIRYDDMDHKILINRHTRLLSSIKQGDPTQTVEIWQEHIRKSVAEFIKKIAEAKLDAFFERPLMSQVIDAKKER